MGARLDAREDGTEDSRGDVVLWSELCDEGARLLGLLQLEATLVEVRMLLEEFDKSALEERVLELDAV